MNRRKFTLGAAALALLAAGMTTGPASAANAEAVTPSFPAPTGPRKVGRVDLHLVDRSRPDPWVGASYREVMATVTYPARRIEGCPTAPYLGPGEADFFAFLASSVLGVPADAIDAAGIRSHAALGAPFDRRGGSRPVIVFAPLHYSARWHSTALAEQLASDGYVVVAVDDTYEVGAVDFPDGRTATTAPSALPPTLPDGNPDLVKLLELLRLTNATRAADVRFVLGELECGAQPTPKDLAKGADFDTIGAYGVNMGSTNAMQMAADDERVKAVVSLADSPGGPHDPQSPVLLDGFDAPFLHLNSTGGDHTSNEGWAALWPKIRGEKQALALAGATDLTYTDYKPLFTDIMEKLGRPLPEDVATMLGAGAPDRSIEVQRAYLTAFFDRHLRGRDSGLLDGPSEDFPEITFVD